LAANDVAVDALFHQTGVIRAETLDEMFDLAAAMQNQPLPLGRRIGIVTNAGGPGILCTDACEAGGLVVPELSEGTKNELRRFLPAAASVSNPVDMIASAGAESYRKTIETVLPSPDIDALIVIYIPVDRNDSEAIAQAIRDGVVRGRAAGSLGKPVLACLMSSGAARSLVAQGETIPSYMFPEAAAKVLAKTVRYAEWRSKPLAMVPGFSDIDSARAKEVVDAAIQSRGAGWLLAEECRALMAAFRIPQAPGGVARTVEQALDIARSVGFPVAAKLASQRVLHKSDAGLVQLNLTTDESVKRAFEEMRQPDME